MAGQCYGVDPLNPTFVRLRETQCVTSHHSRSGEKDAELLFCQVPLSDENKEVVSVIVRVESGKFHHV